MSETKEYPIVYRACPHWPDCTYLYKDPCCVFSEKQQARVVCNSHLTEIERGIKSKDASLKVIN